MWKRAALNVGLLPRERVRQLILCNRVKCDVGSDDHKTESPDSSSDHSLNVSVVPGHSPYPRDSGNSHANRSAQMDCLRLREVSSPLSKFTWLVSNKPGSQNQVGFRAFAPPITNPHPCHCHLNSRTCYNPIFHLREPRLEMLPYHL